jgi:hypothetical protein
LPQTSLARMPNDRERLPVSEREAQLLSRWILALPDE